MLDFLPLLWYCVVLTGGTVYGKHYKRAVARQHRIARGQQNKLKENGLTSVQGRSKATVQLMKYLNT